MDTPGQRRISAASVPITKPAGAMNSAFDTGVNTHKQNGGHFHALPPLKLADTQAVDGPPPGASAGKGRKGKTKYDDILDSLTKDGAGRTGIPRLYKQALASSAAAYLRARPELSRTSRFVVRNDGEDMCGIWRVSRTKD